MTDPQAPEGSTPAIDVLAVTRALDKARASHEAAHQDDLTLVPDFEPLHRSDVPPDEYSGWMFIERGDPTTSDFYTNAPCPLYSYKHGISRRALICDDRGNAYRRTHDSSLRATTGSSNRWDFVGSALAALSETDHYQFLGAERTTAYNEAYQLRRNAALRKAGITVIEF